MEILHQLSLWALYAALALAVYFAVERGLFFFQTSRAFRKLHGLLAQPGGRSSAQAQLEQRAVRGIPGQLMQAAVTDIAQAHSRQELEDASERAYIRAQRQLNQNLWIFDTVITAAPLLGLLGTILGIFDTFTALARSGISDPQGVSAGIGSALLATALGIAVALISLLVYNYFLHWVEHLVDEVKLTLLELTPAQPQVPGAALRVA
jgi:biopolymer transport protein ExbB